MYTPQMPRSSLLRTSASGCTLGFATVRAIVHAAPNSSTEKNTVTPYHANLVVANAASTFIAASAVATPSTATNHAISSSTATTATPVITSPKSSTSSIQTIP